MITDGHASARAGVTGTVVLRWHGSRRHRHVYTIVLDRPLPDGRCMIDAADHNLLILATKAQKGSR
jgi:hypothetical protein